MLYHEVVFSVIKSASLREWDRKGDEKAEAGTPNTEAGAMGSQEATGELWTPRG